MGQKARPFLSTRPPSPPFFALPKHARLLARSHRLENGKETFAAQATCDGGCNQEGMEGVGKRAVT